MKATTKFGKQLTMAWILARKFGHGWWKVVDPDQDDFDALTLDEIHERRVEQMPGWPGISAPEMREDGNFIHESYTGRVSWVIGWDGDEPVVTVTISRQDGDVLSVVIEEIGLPDMDVTIYVLAPFGTRHLDEMERAMKAFEVDVNQFPEYRAAAEQFDAAEMAYHYATDQAEIDFRDKKAKAFQDILDVPKLTEEDMAEMEKYLN